MLPNGFAWLGLLFPVNCGGLLNNTQGRILAVDEDRDGLYDDNQYCIWKFTDETHNSVHLNIFNFSVQKQNESCMFDYLEVGIHPCLFTDHGLALDVSYLSFIYPAGQIDLSLRHFVYNI